MTSFTLVYGGTGEFRGTAIISGPGSLFCNRKTIVIDRPMI